MMLSLVKENFSGEKKQQGKPRRLGFELRISIDLK